MKTIILKILFLSVLTLISSCSFTPKQKSAPTVTTGFLSDYSSLKVHPTASKSQVWRWVSPELTHTGYKTFHIEPLVFYPTPTAKDQVSIEALNDLRKTLYLTAKQSAIDHQLPLIESPQQHTLILRSALTSVATSYKRFSVTELIPVRLIFSGLEFALGKRNKNVVIMLEYKMLDATTGKVVLRGVRRDLELPLVNSKANLTIDHAKPVLRNLVKDMNSEFQNLNQLVFHSS